MRTETLIEKLHEATEQYAKLGGIIDNLKKQLDEELHQQEHATVEPKQLMNKYFKNCINGVFCYLGLTKNNDYFLLTSSGDVCTGEEAIQYIKMYVNSEGCKGKQSVNKALFLEQLDNAVGIFIKTEKDNIISQDAYIRTYRNSIETAEVEKLKSEKMIEKYTVFRKNLVEMIENDKIDIENLHK